MHWYWKGELPDLICDEIIREGESLESKEARVGGTDGGVLDLEVRKSKVSWISQNWLFKLLWEYVIEANKTANWDYQLDRFEPLQYTTYEAPGSHYDWHMDHKEPYENGSYKGLLRKLSVTVQLTDPKEYEGGGFEQMKLTKTPEGELDKEVSTLDSVRSRGSILVFPGFVWHRVLPVTKGTRKSLVGWVVGEPYV